MFKSNNKYNQAVEAYLEKMLRIHKMALQDNQEYQGLMKTGFDKRKGRWRNQKWYEEGDLIWVDIREITKANQGGKLKGFRQCWVKQVSLGWLYNVEYQTVMYTMKFAQIHPQFLKDSKGSLVDVPHPLGRPHNRD